MERRAGKAEPDLETPTGMAQRKITRPEIDRAQSVTKCFRLEDVDRAVDGLQVQLRTAVAEYTLGGAARHAPDKLER